MSRNSPFTQSTSQLVPPETLGKLNDALRALDNAEREATMLQTAGVDQAATLQQIAAQRSQILQFKNVYFPGQ